MARWRRKRRAAALLACTIATCIVLCGTAWAATVTVAAAGDIAKANNPGTAQRQTADVITSVIHPARVLVLGDAQYERGEYSQFLKSYHPTWGSFRSTSAPVPGNHEYETAGAGGYFQYFSSVLSAYGSAAADPKKGYYSFNLGDWHIVALNTNCSASGVNCSAERSWLKSDLQADGHTCELAFSHHPTKSFAQVLAGGGVELMLSGHRHTYERWDRVYGLPIRQLIVGTGGRSLGSPRSGADAGVRAYGVAELELRASDYSWSFLDVGGDERDSGSSSCRA
jgi:hypothetical protein